MKSLEAILNFIKNNRPQTIIQVGDLYDFYAWSKFPRKKEVYTPQAEIGLGREMAEEFWFRCQKYSPESKCFQIIGNHDERPHKRIAETLPAIDLITDAINSLFKFEGVRTSSSQRDELILDGVVYMHGSRPKLGDHARLTGMPTVCGHSHLGGVVYIRNGHRTIWEANCGFIADEFAVPMHYGESKRFIKWTQGFLVIDTFGPRFIHLPNGKR